MTNIMNFLASVENDQIVHYLICSPFFVLIIFVFGIAARSSYECLDEAKAFEKVHKVFNMWCLVIAGYLFMAMMLSVFALTLGYLCDLANFSFGPVIMCISWICLIAFGLMTACACIIGMKVKVN